MPARNCQQGGRKDVPPLIVLTYLEMSCRYHQLCHLFHLAHVINQAGLDRKRLILSLQRQDRHTHTL
jgi:hypothetical protein